MLTKEASYQVCIRCAYFLRQHDKRLLSEMMKKRLRKKLRLREFQKMGFTVAFNLNVPYTDEANDAFFG